MIHEAIRSYYTEDVVAAIKEQDRMMKDLLVKQNNYEVLKSRIIDLYIMGTDKLMETGYKQPINPSNKGRFEIGKELISMFLNDKDKYKESIVMMNSIPELQEAGKLEPKMFEVEFEYYKGFVEYNNKINEDRKRILSGEFRLKIDEYSKDGWFFYYLASPDLPLMHDFCDEQYICSTFTYDNCANIKGLLFNVLNQKHPSDSMRRKIKDLEDVINAINNKGYRSASRTLFSLLESESKNCSNAIRNIQNKRKNLRTGKERAEEITRIISSLNIGYYEDTWRIINNYYKKTTSSKVHQGIINRNGLIHGDYYNDYMDVSLKDVLKLFLLWVNYRVVSDFVQYTVELESDLLQYAMSGVAHKVSEMKSKNSDFS